MEKNSQAIVFVQTAFIGDVFLSLPTIQFLKNKYPTQKIILICKKGLAEVFLKSNFVDIAIEVIKGDKKSYSEALRRLQSYDISLVVCPHRSLTSALFVRKIKAPLKIGFHSFIAKLFFTKTVKYSKQFPDVIRQLELMTLIDPKFLIDFKQNNWNYLNHFQLDSCSFPEIPKQFQFSNSQVKSHSTKKVGLFPGSVWATKKWSVEGFSNVASWLLQKGYIVELMGAPSEQPEAQVILKSNPDCVNRVGQLSLSQSYLQMKEYDFILCNDSAPAHMAASLGVPAVVIFGPTVLDFGFRPWNDRSIVVENRSINCRPCGAHGPQVCPLGHHQCMKSISAQQVIEMIEKNFINL